MIIIMILIIIIIILIIIIFQWAKLRETLALLPKGEVHIENDNNAE